MNSKNTNVLVRDGFDGETKFINIYNLYSSHDGRYDIYEVKDIMKEDIGFTDYITVKPMKYEKIIKFTFAVNMSGINWKTDSISVTADHIMTVELDGSYDYERNMMGFAGRYNPIEITADTLYDLVRKSNNNVGLYRYALTTDNKVDLGFKLKIVGADIESYNDYAYSINVQSHKIIVKEKNTAIVC
jgi:hypothetical protein